jgi:histidinol-phosphate aminotransferase
MGDLNIDIKKYLKTNVGNYVDKNKGIEIFSDEIKREYGLTKIYKHDLGENTDGPSPNVISEFSKKVLDPNLLSEYPDSSYAALRKNLGDLYGLKFEYFSIGTGCNELIQRISRIWLNRNDTVIFPIPSFFKIEDITLQFGGIPIYINLREVEGFQWTSRITDEVVAVIEKARPKLIWLVTPNNPTGVSIPIDDIEHIIRQNRDRSIIVVDEAYGEFADDSDKSNSAISLVRREIKNLLVLRTFSKAYGLAGLRIGYCAGRKDIIKLVERARLEFPVGSLASKLAIQALHDQSYIADSVMKVSKNRKSLELSLQGIDDIQYLPSITNTVLIKHHRLNLYRELLKRGILVARMEITGLIGNNYIRMTIKDPEENNIVVNAIQNLGR